MATKRMERANAQIQKCLSAIIAGLNDPRINSQIISITSVNTSPDFSICKIGVSIYDEQKEQKKDVLTQLKKSSGHIKHLLAQELDMPHIPALVFINDEGFDYSKRIEDILKTITIPKDNDDEN